MHRCKIEWVPNPDNKTLGWVWNPITGCLNNCSYCYARKLANGRLKSRYLANKNIANLILSPKGGFPIGYSPYNDPFYPRFWEERLLAPCGKAVHRGVKTPILYGQRPKGIFVCDMGELFGDWVPREWQDKIFEVIEDCPQHRFYLLTKQPQNLIKFSPFPDNCWVGVTVTDAHSATNTYHLAQVKASIKFISFEPLLEAINLWGINSDIIQWVIIGAQTKPYKPPQVEHVEEIETSAKKTGIAIFEKDNLKPLLKRELIQELPE